MVTNSLTTSPLVELRRYTLRPGAFDHLLFLFEGVLIEAQEQCGMVIAGTFADEQAPDTFTWMRGFSGHESRVAALDAFYGGRVWATYAAAANSTMLDTDDVLLLRPLDPPWSPAPAVQRRRPGAGMGPERALVLILGLEPEGDHAAAEDWFARIAAPTVQDTLGVRVAAWRSDPTPNGFPRLPVRDDRVLVVLAVFADDLSRDLAALRLVTSPIHRELERRTSWQQVLRLTPTTRSAHPVVQAARSGSAGVPPEAGS